MCHRAAKAAVQYGRHGLRGERAGLHVFVAGAQRSGTNMVMNVLDRSLETTVYHERDPRAFDRYLMREPEVIDELVARARGRVFVIKALCEMDRLPSLMERYQPAKTLWVYRHYDGAVQSSLRSFSTVAAQVSEVVRDPARGGWMGRGMSDETLGRIRALHHPGMNDASRVALFWYMRNRLLFDTGLATDPRVLPVRYERLLDAPHERLQPMFASIGLEYRRNMGRHVAPPPDRRREPPAIEPTVRRACDELLAALDRAGSSRAAA